jgi:hypothetical protein
MVSPKKKRSATRDGGRFLALPYTVLDSPAFMNLPAPAVRLLLDVARQYDGNNNGKLLASDKYLSTRGWTSHDTALRARRELELSGLIFETRKGMRPNRTAWYAVTWLTLDWTPDMDIKRENFTRGAYAKTLTLPVVPKTRALPRQAG